MSSTSNGTAWSRGDTLVRPPAYSMAYGGLAGAVVLVLAGVLLERHVDVSGWTVWPFAAFPIAFAAFGAALIVRRARWDVRVDDHDVRLTISDASGRVWKRQSIARADVVRAVWTERDSEYPTGLTLLGSGRRRLVLPVELVDDAAARELVGRYLPHVALERSR